MRQSYVVIAACLVMAGCAESPATQAPPTTASAAPQAAASPPAANVPSQLAAFRGRWTGIWDNSPALTTTLNIDTVSPEGEITGTYIYTTFPPSRFRVKIENNVFRFGSRSVFTFTMLPDGRISGERNTSGEINTTLLTRQ